MQMENTLFVKPGFFFRSCLRFMLGCCCSWFKVLLLHHCRRTASNVRDHR
jgi:hypothetical protein